MISIGSILLAGEGFGGPWNILIVLFVGAMALLNWLADRAKKQQQEREIQERKRQGEMPRQQPRQIPQTRITERSAQRRPTPSGGQMRRYQPEIPSAGGRGPVFPSRTASAGQEESELIIVAEDVSVEAARQRLSQQQQRERLRAEAIRRAALQDQKQRVRQARAKAEKVVHREPVSQKQQEELAPLSTFSAIRSTVLGEVSSRQLRRGIIWAEILGPPRAMRPLEESLRANQRR